MEWSQWTLLDFLFVVILVTSTIFALLKGLAREVISLLALIGGLLLASIYYRTAGVWFSRFAASEPLQFLLGFLAIFIGCLVLGALLAFAVNRFLKLASLEWVDRLLGGVFGFFRGWLVTSVIVLALVAFPVKPAFVSESVLAPFLLAGSRAAVLLVPAELKNRFHSEYGKVIDAWHQNRSSL